MSPQIRLSPWNGPDRQRGAIGLMAACTLALALLCMLLVVDSGRLYLEKRKLQRVADMSALEAASRGGQCMPASTASTYASQSASRNGFTVTDNSQSLTIACGVLSLNVDKLRTFNADASKTDAIRVTVTHSVPKSIIAGIDALLAGGSTDPNVNLIATAVAARALPPLASLTIKSTLVDIDSSKSSALNLLFGGLLGGNLNISVAGWKGLADANLNLLSYLDQLAIDLKLNAGDYTQLLGTDIKLTQILDTAIKVLPQDNPAVQITVDSLLAIKAIAADTTLKLQDLLHLQTGTPTAGMDLNLNLFQWVEGLVQLTNSQSSLYATIPANVLGLAGAVVRVKVIEPPQLSAAGDPLLAKADPMGPNRIYVRTAQIRTLVSVDLGIVNTVLQGVNTVLSLPLSLLGVDLQIAPQGLNLDVSLEAASASSHITDYTCTSSTDKSLTASTTTAAATLKIGKVDASAWNSSKTDLIVNELPLIDIGTGHPRVAYGGGGLGLLIDSPVAISTPSMATHTYENPPEINQSPDPFYSFNSQNIVNSLKATLNGIQVINHPPKSPGLLGLVLGLVTSTINGVLSLLASLVGDLLGGLLDPLLNLVLQSLGMDLAKVDVGANLSCNAGQASLVI